MRAFLRGMCWVRAVWFSSCWCSVCVMFVRGAKGQDAAQQCGYCRSGLEELVKVACVGTHQGCVCMNRLEHRRSRTSRSELPSSASPSSSTRCAPSHAICLPQVVPKTDLACAAARFLERVEEGAGGCDGKLQVSVMALSRSPSGNRRAGAEGAEKERGAQHVRHRESDCEVTIV